MCNFVSYETISDLVVANLLQPVRPDGTLVPFKGANGYQKTVNSSIFKMLKPSARARLLSDSSEWWEPVHDSWKAFICSVLLACDSNQFDESSAETINRLKKWFLTIGSLNFRLLLKILKDLGTQVRVDSCLASNFPYKPMTQFPGTSKRGGKPYFDVGVLKGCFFDSFRTDRIKALSQLSLFARALPVGDESVQEKSMEDHRAVMLSETAEPTDLIWREDFCFNPDLGRFPSKEDLAELARDRRCTLFRGLTYRIGLRIRNKGGRVSPKSHVSLSTSSSMSCPRSKGGFLTETLTSLYKFLFRKLRTRQYSLRQFLLEGFVDPYSTESNSYPVYSPLGDNLLDKDLLDILSDHCGQDGVAYCTVANCPLCSWDGGWLFSRGLIPERYRDNYHYEDVYSMVLDFLFDLPLAYFYGMKLTDLQSIKDEENWSFSHLDSVNSRWPNRTWKIRPLFIGPGFPLILTMWSLTLIEEIGVWESSETTGFHQKFGDFYGVPVGKDPEFRASFILNRMTGPKTRAYIVAEGGWKGRAITIGDPRYSLLSQRMTHPLEDLFELDPRARVSWGTANPFWDFCEFLKKSPMFQCKTHGIESSDLTASTDYFTFEWLEHGWKGFLSGMDCPLGHPTRLLSPLVWHPRLMNWDTALSGDQLPLGAQFELTRRGSLMGENQSKLSLTLMSLSRLEVNELLCQGINIFTRTGYHRFLSEIPDLKFRVPGGVNGDDLISLHNRFGYMISGRFLKLMRLQVSPKDFFSMRNGVFMEDQVEVLTTNGKRELRYLNLIKTRLLMGRGRTGLRSDQGSPFVGQSLMLGNQIRWARFDGVVSTTDMAESLFRKVWRVEIDMLKHIYLDPPRMLGGISLLKRTPMQYTNGSLRDHLFIDGIHALLASDLKTLFSFLSRLYSRFNHGIYVKLAGLRKYFESLKFQVHTEYDPEEEEEGIYTVDAVLNALRLTDCPRELFEMENGKPKYRDLPHIIKNQFGLVNLKFFPDQVARLVAFREMLHFGYRRGEENPFQIKRFRRESRCLQRNIVAASRSRVFTWTSYEDGKDNWSEVATRFERKLSGYYLKLPSDLLGDLYPIVDLTL